MTNTRWLLISAIRESQLVSLGGHCLKHSQQLPLPLSFAPGIGKHAALRSAPHAGCKEFGVAVVPAWELHASSFVPDAMILVANYPTGRTACCEHFPEYVRRWPPAATTSKKAVII